MAVNCSLRPFGNAGDAGVTAIETRVAAVTVNVALLEVIPAEDALICESPTATVVTLPWEPATLLIVATPTALEDQTTWEVRSCLEWSVNRPVAFNDCVVP